MRTINSMSEYIMISLKDIAKLKPGDSLWVARYPSNVSYWLKEKTMTTFCKNYNCGKNILPKGWQLWDFKLQREDRPYKTKKGDTEIFKGTLIQREA